MDVDVEMRDVSTPRFPLPQMSIPQIGWTSYVGLHWRRTAYRPSLSSYTPFSLPPLLVYNWLAELSRACTTCLEEETPLTSNDGSGLWFRGELQKADRMARRLREVDEGHSPAAITLVEAEEIERTAVITAVACHDHEFAAPLLSEMQQFFPPWTALRTTLEDDAMDVDEMNEEEGPITDAMDVDSHPPNLPSGLIRNERDDDWPNMDSREDPEVTQLALKLERLEAVSIIGRQRVAAMKGLPPPEETISPWHVAAAAAPQIPPAVIPPPPLTSAQPLPGLVPPPPWSGTAASAVSASAVASIQGTVNNVSLPPIASVFPLYFAVASPVVAASIPSAPMAAPSSYTPSDPKLGVMAATASSVVSHTPPGDSVISAIGTSDLHPSHTTLIASPSRALPSAPPVFVPTHPAPPSSTAVEVGPDSRIPAVGAGRSIFPSNLSLLPSMPISTAPQTSLPGPHSRATMDEADLLVFFGQSSSAASDDVSSSSSRQQTAEASSSSMSSFEEPGVLAYEESPMDQRMLGEAPAQDGQSPSNPRHAAIAMDTTVASARDPIDVYAAPTHKQMSSPPSTSQGVITEAVKYGFNEAGYLRDSNDRGDERATEDSYADDGHVSMAPIGTLGNMVSTARDYDDEEEEVMWSDEELLSPRQAAIRLSPTAGRPNVKNSSEMDNLADLLQNVGMSDEPQGREPKSEGQLNWRSREGESMHDEEDAELSNVVSPAFVRSAAPTPGNTRPASPTIEKDVDVNVRGSAAVVVNVDAEGENAEDEGRPTRYDEDDEELLWSDEELFVEAPISSSAHRSSISSNGPSAVPAPVTTLDSETNEESSNARDDESEVLPEEAPWAEEQVWDADEEGTNPVGDEVSGPWQDTTSEHVTPPDLSHSLTTSDRHSPISPISPVQPRWHNYGFPVGGGWKAADGDAGEEEEEDEGNWWEDPEDQP